MPTPLTHDDPMALGAYRLVARLGSGGMGTVYLARSAGGRTVALKTMHARIATDPAFRTRFRLESDAARVIGGQYGARVVDADPTAETPWLATEYVLGPPLDEAVELAGPLPEASVRALGAALCTALGQLHGSDVVHRDLKPSNIMVTAYGPKVIDFGIARAIGDDRLTHTGAAVGTPAFMSPEQATGQEHTPAGDVFALAGVLVYASTGAGPFGHGQPADLLYRVRYAEADLGRVPRALAPLLAACLDKDPAKRPTTAQLAGRLHDGGGEFADHLPDAVLAEIGRRAAEVWQVVPQRLAPPAGGVPAPDGDEAPARPARRRVLALWGGIGVAVVAAGAGTWAWRERRGGASNGEPDTAAAQAHDPAWTTQAVDFSAGRATELPVPVGNLVLLAGGNIDGVDARTGRARWQDNEQGRTWQIAVDDSTGTVYRFVDSEETAEHKKDPWPLLIATMDLSKGRTNKPFARFTDVNGGLEQTQLLCAADGVLYLAAGTGTYSMDGFSAGQRWFLQAVEAKTGRRLWSKPLPAREDDAPGLHFHTASVAGDYLVAVQEGDDDAVHGVVRDTRTGEVRFERDLDTEWPVVPLTTSGTHVYVGEHQLRALRLSDGKQDWALAATDPEAYFGPPTLVDDVLYAVEDGVGLVAVDAASGKRLWAEKNDQGDKVDLVCPPVVGTAYAYYKRGVDLKAVRLSTHRPAFTYAEAGDIFIPDARRRMIIGVTRAKSGTEFTVCGIPLT